jgi:hypothetical protein
MLEESSCDESPTLFAYDRLLGPDYIRVLHLHTTTTGADIECYLEQIKYEDSGYQALSYVWGSEEKPYGAIVRDKQGETLGHVPLTTNLANALRDLRDAKDGNSKVF